MYRLNIDKEKLNNGGISKIRTNREYLLRKTVAREVNTYLNFSKPFKTFSDVIPGEERTELVDSKTGEFKKDMEKQVGAPGLRSIFNKYGAVLLGGNVNMNDEFAALTMSEWRASTNTPLIDTPENRKTIRQNSGYTIKELVDASQAGVLGCATYAYSDFMYCKYLGQLPNNYLITLRRFPTPVDDYISSAGLGNTRKEIQSSNPLPIGQLVTWMNTPGNELDKILTYSVSMPWEQKQADWEQSDIDADSSSKPLNAAAALFDKTYRAQVASGYGGKAIADYTGKLFPFKWGKYAGEGHGEAPYHGYQGWQDKNKVYGPVDAVKKVYYRGKDGIDFDQTFTLTFEYELRSYNGINGRQAMLDLISNILNVTYTTGTFWGGGYTAGGAHQNNIFANLEIMKAGPGFSNFMSAFLNDISTVTSSTSTSIKANGGVIQTIKNIMNDLGGMLLGGFLNKLGRPQKSRVASLLSPAPTGFWHVVIGNPFHPIMSLGNMILKKTTITHSGPLGLDDFPSGLKVECELERGKPRDLRGIEMIYMNGNDRIYHSMGPKVFDMYNNAKEYKTFKEELLESSQSAWAGIKELYGAISDKEEYEKEWGKIRVTSTKAWVKSKDIFMKYFGKTDESSIQIPAEEQEYGSQQSMPGKGKTQAK